MSANEHKKSQPLRLIWLPTGGHIGDAIFITALFAEVLQHNNDAQIYYVVRRNAAPIAELAKEYQNIKIVPIPFSFIGAFKSVAPLFRHRSVVIAPPPRHIHPLYIRVLCILFMLRGDNVIGYEDIKGWRFFSRTLTYEPNQRYIDNLRHALSLASISTESEGASPHLKLKTALPPNFPFASKPYIVVHPFPHMSTTKTLPMRRWKHLVKEIRRLYPSYGLVITGAEVDRTLAQELVPPNDSEVVLAINLPLLQVAGIIEKSGIYIGIDTGPTHMAGVLRVPSVILAQQSEPAWLPSYNPNATLLWEKKNCTCRIPGEKCIVIEEGKGYRRCVYDLSDEQILGAVKDRFSAKGV